MSGMKTEHMNFRTRKTMDQIREGIRRAAAAERADLLALDGDPLGGVNQPEIAVLLDGVHPLNRSRRWGVQVYVTELGQERGVELVALGEGTWARALHQGGYSLGLSKKRWEKIAGCLR